MATQHTAAIWQSLCKVPRTAHGNLARQVFCKLNVRSLRRVYGNIARKSLCKVPGRAYGNVVRQVFSNLNARSLRRVYGNIAKQPFGKLYARFPEEHMAMLPCKCFASLMLGRFGEYMATLPGNLLAIFMQGSPKSIWQCCQASVLQA